MSDVGKFFDPYDDTASITGADGVIVDIGKVLAKTREVMERVQFEQLTDISFEDIANFETVLAVISANFGTFWVNHIGMTASAIIHDNYDFEAANVPLTTSPFFADQFTLPESAWETGRDVINLHASGFSSMVYTKGLENADVVADVLLTTFFTYCFKVAELTNAGHAIQK